MRKTIFIISLLTFTLNSYCQQYHIASINFIGNKVTKDKILLAEINIKIGDSLNILELESKLEANSERLYNLQLFHWVKYGFLTTENSIDVTFEVQERWYIWPVPIFSLADRNLNSWLNKMDFNRVDYGLHTAWYNFRGRNEQLISNIQHGYNRKYEIFYNLPQINKKQNIGLDLGASYFQSHYLDYNNLNAVPLTLRLENDFPINKKYIRIGVINRNTVENINNLRFEINQQSLHDSILALNSNYHLTGNNKTYMQFEINKVLNTRKTFSYPTSGSFFEMSFRHRLFLEKGESPSSRIRVQYSKYLPIDKHHLYSFGLNGQYTFVKNLSTSENIALGYKKNIRGFDYYVTDGQHFLTAQQNISKTIIDNRTINLGFIPSDKFNEVPLSIYYTLFTDAAYVFDDKYNNTNTLSNALLYSIGTGIHFVSYYDQVFVLEYTLNSLKEHGIFVSTKFSF